MAPEDLETTLKEKVAPLLEESMEKHWGISIPQIESDITDKLRNPALQCYISPQSTFSQAKKKFKTAFLKKELHFHLGNISQLAKTLGIDRRSIHRAVRDLSINLKEIRLQDEPTYEMDLVNHTIRSALEQYRTFIQPQQLEKMYADVPHLSRNIAKLLPHQELTWKQAEREFERQFLHLALEAKQGNVLQTARHLHIRPETLYRKIKRLGIKYF